MEKETNKERGLAYMRASSTLYGRGCGCAVSRNNRFVREVGRSRSDRNLPEKKIRG